MDLSSGSWPPTRRVSRPPTGPAPARCACSALRPARYSCSPSAPRERRRGEPRRPACRLPARVVLTSSGMALQECEGPLVEVVDILVDRGVRAVLEYHELGVRDCRPERIREA